MNDQRGLCPSGWHVPTDQEWQDLEVFLGMPRADVSLDAGIFDLRDRGSVELGIGDKLKTISGWENGGNGSDNEGFSALPGGFRFTHESFFSAGTYGRWWASSTIGDDSFFRELRYQDARVLRSEIDNRLGLSVRCLKDE